MKKSAQIRTVAGVSDGLGGGSGEARVASSIAKLLNDYGIPATFTITRDYATPARNGLPYTTFGDGYEQPRVINMAGTRGGTISSDDYNSLLDAARRGGADIDLFKYRLAKGDFDGFAVQELRNLLKLSGADVVSGRLPVVANDKLTDLGAGVFSGEGGMRYSTLRGVSPSEIRSSNRVPDKYLEDFLEKRHFANDINPSVRNLSEGFFVNYNPRYSTHLMPGHNVKYGLLNRLDIVQQYLHNRDSKFVRDYISKINPQAVLDGKKLISLWGGSANPYSKAKLDMLLKALDGRDDYHILAQVGNKTLSGGNRLNGGDDPAARRAIADFYASVPKDRITVTETVPFKDMQRFYRGTDVNAGYGGSSSAVELAGTGRPLISFADSAMNGNNLQYINNTYDPHGPGHIDSRPEYAATEQPKLTRWLNNTLDNMPLAERSARARASSVMRDVGNSTERFIDNSALSYIRNMNNDNRFFLPSIKPIDFGKFALRKVLRRIW